MSRKLRIEYPGAMYHVLNRGDQREDIFRDDEDRQKFLSTLGEACAKTEWQGPAYCLMRIHFHLVLETPQPNFKPEALVRGQFEVADGPFDELEVPPPQKRRQRGQGGGADLLPRPPGEEKSC